MSEKLTRFPERSTDTSASEKIIPFSEFNKESAEANVQAAKAEIEKNKDVAEYGYRIKKVHDTEGRLNRAIELNAPQEVLGRFEKKHLEALNAAKIVNDRSIHDEHFDKFMKENKCPVFSKAA